MFESDFQLNLDKRIVTFIGPEGSGKTSLAKRLSQEAQKPYVSTGDLLRDLNQNDHGPLGDQVRAMFEGHYYLDPNILLEILADRFSKKDLNGGFVLDGGLRTLTETVDFPLILKKTGRDFPMIVVHLRIPGWLGVERTVTGDGARKRADDTIEAVLNRLSGYYFQLGQRASFINQQPNWSLVHVNTMGTKEMTYQNLCAALASSFTNLVKVS